MIDYAALKSRLPPLEVIAAQYGYHPNRSGKILCPFHPDTRPSLSFKNERFHCFSCNARGDAIDLVARFEGITAAQAAQLLADRYGTTPPTVTTSQRDNRIELFNAWTDRAAILWIRYIRLLEHWRDAYRPSDPAQPFDERFNFAVQEIDRADYIFQEVFLAQPREDRFTRLTQFYNEQGDFIKILERHLGDDYGERHEARVA